MSETSHNTSTSPSTDLSSLGGVVNEAPISLITIVHLDGTNFLAWSQSTKLYITGKGKAAYLIGDAKMTNPKDDICKMGSRECDGDVMASSFYATKYFK